MNIRLLLLLLFLPILMHGNMANPWMEGSAHSSLYGVENCQVIKEHISIQLINNRNIYFAKYKIKYVINSNKKQTVPLLFIGIGLSDKKRVKVNDLSTEIKSYHSNNPSFVNYSKNDSIAVDRDDLIFFEAELRKGKNIIYVEYDADLKSNNQGFVRKYELIYSLYPSKFWESFGEIDLELIIDDSFEITSSNIGIPKIENGIAYWNIKKIENDNIELHFSKKTNIVADVLIFIHPFGISFIFLILMFIYHRKLLIKKHKTKDIKFKSVLSLGIIMVPIMYYFLFFCSFEIIDLTLNQRRSDHGYTFLYVFTLPFLMLFYGILMWTVDWKLKIKYRKS